jgi:hypothetical protein
MILVWTIDFLVEVRQQICVIIRHMTPLILWLARDVTNTML